MDQISGTRFLNDTQEPVPTEIYHRERRLLVDIEQKSADQYGKAILTLTAASLGLSISFAEKVVANPRPELFWIVGVSWSAFILGIGCIVGSFLTSQSACRTQRDLLDAEHSSGRVPEQINRFSDVTRHLNIMAYVFFMAGVVSFAIFSWLNLPW